MTTTVPTGMVAQDGGIRLAHLHSEVSTAFAPSPNVKLSGDPIQLVYAESGSYASGTTQVPIGSTVPTSTQGDQYMTATITPKATTNLLVIEVVANVGANAVAQITAALFQDAGTNAIAAGIAYNTTANAMLQISFRHMMLAGTVAATTFKLRIGPNVAATVGFNGTTQGLLGGVLVSSITITEFKP